jgi:hypothetical protein
MSELKKRPSPSEDAEAKRAKTETKPGAAYSKVFHQNVAPSCTRIDSLELESHPRSELDWEQLHGMENIKQALGDHILTPMQHPEFFALQPSFFRKRGQAGRIPFERVFALAGPYGMGRRRLVYNLCKSKGMTLFDVQPIQFDPFRDLGVIYEQAVAEAPSVVLFDTCEDHFFEHKPAVGKLHYHLNQIAENKLPVWTVFLMHSRPSLLHADIRPPPECQLVTPMLQPAECSAVFDQALAERLDRAEDVKGAVALVDSSVLLRCHMASKDYSPKEIHDWLDRVFKRALFNQRKALESCDRDDPIFYPTAADFSELLFTVPGKLDTRLGRVDPATINVLPYLSADEERHIRLNSAKAPMPMPMQNNRDYGFEY